MTPKGSSICSRRIVSFGGRLRDVLASFFISSELRSRILTSSATIAATSLAIAPLAIMSAMNFLTASRSGASALVIGGDLSLAALIASGHLPDRRYR
ncbi:MAG: hypothetical protein ABSF69_29390 [Polyangiaceae bacterium]